MHTKWEPNASSISVIALTCEFYYGVEINATFKDRVFTVFVKPIVKVEHPTHFLCRWIIMHYITCPPIIQHRFEEVFYMNIANLWTLPNVKHKVKLIISLNICSSWGSESRLGILYLLCRRGRDLTHFVEARTLYNVLPIWNSRCKIPTVFGKAAEGALQIHFRGDFLEWFAIGILNLLLTYLRHRGSRLHDYHQWQL